MTGIVDVHLIGRVVIRRVIALPSGLAPGLISILSADGSEHLMDVGPSAIYKIAPSEPQVGETCTSCWSFCREEPPETKGGDDEIPF